MDALALGTALVLARRSGILLCIQAVQRSESFMGHAASKVLLMRRANPIGAAVEVQQDLLVRASGSEHADAPLVLGVDVFMQFVGGRTGADG